MMRLPSRQLTSLEAPKSWPSLSHCTSRCPFSSSARVDIRQRPGRLRRIIPRDSTFESSAPKLSLSEERMAKSQPRPIQDSMSNPPASKRVREKRHEPVSQAAAGTKPSLGPAPEPATVIQEEVTPVPPSTKNALLSVHVISKRPGEALRAESVKDTDRRFAAAHAFFTEGGRFLYSAAELRDHAANDHAPEIAVMGASNAGKSTFLNALMGKAGVARTGQRPGLTTLMNAYGVGPRPHVPKPPKPQQQQQQQQHQPKAKPGGGKGGGDTRPQYGLHIVDTPGYGFKSQKTWGQAVLSYIEQRRALRGAVVLLSMDKKKGALEHDLWLLRALARLDTPTLVVLTKADRCGAEWLRQTGAVADGVHEQLRRLVDGRGGGRNGMSTSAGGGPTSRVYVTAAGIDVYGGLGALGNGAGIGGVRMAMLEMAGFNVTSKGVEKAAEQTSYWGPVVPFEEVRYK